MSFAAGHTTYRQSNRKHRNDRQRRQARRSHRQEVPIWNSETVSNVANDNNQLVRYNPNRDMTNVNEIYNYSDAARCASCSQRSTGPQYHPQQNSSMGGSGTCIRCGEHLSFPSCDWCNKHTLACEFCKECFDSERDLKHHFRNNPHLRCFWPGCRSDLASGIQAQQDVQLHIFMDH
jgi:hypothetical protein